MFTIRDLFMKSKSCRILLSYKTVDEIINDYEFPVRHIDSVPTIMHGSARQFTCRIFERVGKAGPGAKEQILGRPCDPIFQDAFRTCMEGRDAVSKHVKQHVEEFYSTKPERKRTVVPKYSA